ncbi:MAG: FecCD family ABC transporter permease [Burkholderiales bacterium]
MTDPLARAPFPFGSFSLHRHSLLLGAGLLLLAALALIAMASGRYAMTPAEIVDSFRRGIAGQRSLRMSDEVLWQIRLPRIALASLVGAALGAAGAAFQHLFRNPLVSPDTLGVSSGAALGAVLAIFAGAGAAVAATAAFGGGLLTVALVTALAARIRAHDRVLMLVLIGVVIASLGGAAISLVKFVADPYNQLPAITFWLMGSFAASTWQQVAIVAPAILIAIALLAALAWRINLLALPEDEAQALGVHASRLRAIVIAAATVATAASVAVCGIVGWVGLVVPHMARLAAGPEFSRLLPLSALFGAIFLLAIDTLARAATAIEVPPGILTAFIGTPLFLVLLARRSV